MHPLGKVVPFILRTLFNRLLNVLNGGKPSKDVSFGDDAGE